LWWTSAALAGLSSVGGLASLLRCRSLWLVWTVVLVESRAKLWPQALRVLSGAAAMTVLLAWLFPGQSHAVANRWAPLHWVLGLVSYGLVGASVLHAWLMQRAERQMRQPGQMPMPGWPLMRLERLTFQFLLAGVAALTLALLLGWWVSPGWHWDHKTLFACLAWVVLTGLLGARHALGWRGAQAVRWLYGGALLLLLSYAGSRFVVEVLLGRSV
jgi:ABC-type uncharacterized transport system permease subunit